MKKRIEWIDVLRGIGMYLVILGHAFINRKDVFRKYIYSFHMPLFFFISGLTYRDKNYNLIEFIKDKIKKLILPYIIINIAVFIIKFIMHLFLNIYNNLSIIESLKSLFNGYGNNLPCIQSWFLLCLVVVEFLFYIIKKLSKNDIQVSIYVFICMLFSIFLSYNKTKLPFWHFDTAFMALFFYYLGYIYMKKLKDIKIDNKIIKIGVIISTLIISIIVQKYNPIISMNVNRYNNAILFLVSSIASIYFYMNVAMLIENKDKVFKYIGMHSIFFLGYHAFFLTIIKTYFPQFLESTILTIIISALAAAIIYPFCELVYKKCPILIGKIK